MSFLERVVDIFAGKASDSPLYNGMTRKERRDPEKRRRRLNERHDIYAKICGNLESKCYVANLQGHLKVEYYSSVFLREFYKTAIAEESASRGGNIDSSVCHSALNCIPVEVVVDEESLRPIREKMADDEALIALVPSAFDDRLFVIWKDIYQRKLAFAKSQADRARKRAEKEATERAQDLPIVAKIEELRNEIRRNNELFSNSYDRDVKVRLIYSIEAAQNAIRRLKHGLRKPITDEKIDEIR